jgi:hypothetical protein
MFIKLNTISSVQYLFSKLIEKILKNEYSLIKGWIRRRAKQLAVSKSTSEML